MKKILRLIHSTKLSNTLLTIMLLGLLLRMYNLDQSFWLDEGAQVMASSRSLSQQWQLQADFQPPLYYYLVHFWMWGGSGEWYLRMLSVGFGLATIYIVFLLGKTVKNTQTGLYAAFLLAIAPYHIYYSQELRMYSLSALLASLLIYTLLKREWWWHTLVLLACWYTFYLLPLMLVVELVYIWSYERKYFRPWLHSFLISLLGFSIWIPVFIKQLSLGIDLPQIWPQWRNLSSPGLWKTFPLTYAKFALGRITLTNKYLYGSLILLSSLIVLPILYQAWKVKKRYINLFIYWLIIPIFLAWLISFWVPVNGPWRLLFTLPAFYLLLALGVDQMKKSLIKTVLFSGIVIISLTGTFLYHTNPDFHREDWRSAVQVVEEKATQNPESMITFAFPEPFAPYSWYAPKAIDKNSSLRLGLTPNLVVDEQTYLMMNQNLNHAKTVYHFEYLSDLTDPQRKIPQWFKDHDYKLAQTLNFHGVGFVFEYQK